MLSETGLLGAVAFLTLLLCFIPQWPRGAVAGAGRPGPAAGAELRLPGVAAVSINIVLMLFMGFAGHNLFPLQLAVVRGLLRRRRGLPARSRRRRASSRGWPQLGFAVQG